MTPSQRPGPPGARRPEPPGAQRAETPGGGDQAAFLLAQLGAHAAARFAERIAPLGVTPPQAGVLRLLRRQGPLSQTALAAALGVVPSRVVVLLDRLVDAGLVDRSPSETDRRLNLVALTEGGRTVLAGLREAAEAHQRDLCAGLGDDELRELTRMLRVMARHQGLRQGVHPGYSRAGTTHRDAEEAT